MTTGPIDPSSEMRPINISAEDTHHLEELGFSPTDVYDRVKGFLSSTADASLSLGKGKVITIHKGALRANFSGRDADLSFLFQKALEIGQTKPPEEFDKLFVRTLKACEVLAIDHQKMFSLKPTIRLSIQESDGRKVECQVPSNLLDSSPVIQDMLAGLSFSSANSSPIILPEGYTFEHFKAYVEMSNLNALFGELWYTAFSEGGSNLSTLFDMLGLEDYFSGGGTSALTLLDIMRLADYFEDTGLALSLDKALNQYPNPTIEDIGHILKSLHQYPKEKTYLSHFISHCIANAILRDKENTSVLSFMIDQARHVTGTYIHEPLSELVAQLHSLDTSKHLQTSLLELNLAGLGNKLNDKTLETLRSLKISSLNITYSNVTRLPDTWLSSLEFLNISKTDIAVLQKLPNLKSFRAVGCFSLRDISGLDCNEQLETIHLDILPSLVRMPSILSGVKHFSAGLCDSLTNLDALNYCIQLETIDLWEMRALVRIPNGLRGLKEFKARTCKLLTNLDALNGCAQLEKIDLSYLESLVRMPSGLSGLKELKIDSCERLANLDDLNGCAQLEVLKLFSLWSLVGIPTGLSGLKCFIAIACDLLTNLDALNGHSQLEVLELSSLRDLVEIPTGLSGLKEFKARACKRLTNLDTLNGCSQLEKIDLYYLPALVRMPSELSELRGLKELKIAMCEQLANLEVLNGCSQLELLELVSLWSLVRIPTGLNGLREIRLHDCYQLADVSALIGLLRLQQIKVANCPLLTNPLQKLLLTSYGNYTSIEELREVISEVDIAIQNRLHFGFWLYNGMPEGDPEFGKHFLETSNFVNQVILKTMKSYFAFGDKMISQEDENMLKLLPTMLASFNQKKIEIHATLSKEAQALLFHTIWVLDGSKTDVPLNYAEQLVRDNPNTPLLMQAAQKIAAALS